MSSALIYNNWKEERINDVPYSMSPSATPKHAGVISNIHNLFRNYLKGKSCKVYTDTIDIIFDKRNIVVPDVSVICNKNSLTDRGCEGVPDLLVEILSPTSIKRDKIKKYELYEKFGVREYWIVDPNMQSLEQYILVENKYCLKDIYVIANENEQNRMNETDRNNYTTKFNCHIFSDLVVDIIDVFED